jgi:hypothetical protein
MKLSTFAISDRLFSRFLQSATVILASFLESFFATFSDNKLENSINVLWRLSSDANKSEQTSWWMRRAVDNRSPVSELLLVDERWNRIFLTLYEKMLTWRRYWLVIWLLYYISIILSFISQVLNLFHHIMWPVFQRIYK